MHILKQIDVEPVEIEMGKIDNLVIYDVNGQLVPRGILNEAYDFFMNILESVEAEIDLKNHKKGPKKIAIGTIFQKTLETHKLYPALHESHKRLFHWFVADYECRMMCNFNEVSVEAGLKDYQYKCYRVPGGLGQIPHGLAFGPGYDPTLDIICESPIDQVIYRGSGIEVRSGNQSFTGGCIVLAIPLTAFKVN